MKARSKRYRELEIGLDRKKGYSIEEAVRIASAGQGAKFDEAVELALLLGVDPKHAEQQVRGTVQLPHGVGKKVRIAAFAKGDKAKEALSAGADVAGAEELVAKIQGGWMEFDATVATPDLMREVGKLGKLLGPKGLMPSPKTGTVTFDIGKAVAELKAGRVEFRVDKQANLHMVVGRRSFTGEQLRDNIRSALEAIVQAKPAVAKGQYLKRVAICTTMGVGVKLDTAALGSLGKG